MSKLPRSLAATAGLIATCALIAIGAGAVGAKSRGKPVHGVVYFAITHTANGKEYAAGNGTSSLFGTEAVTYVITVGRTPTGSIKVTANPVTTWGKLGTLTGTATSTLTVSGTTETFSNGKLSQTKGTGAWVGHSITATFSGSGNTTTGLLKITYRGTYK
jgi:hypothetical protein